MTHTSDERKFWADVFLAKLDRWGEYMAAVLADESIAAYRERFGGPAGVAARWLDRTPVSAPALMRSGGWALNHVRGTFEHCCGDLLLVLLPPELGCRDGWALQAAGAASDGSPVVDMGSVSSMGCLSRIVDGLLGRNCPETPDSSPNETCEATAAFYKALTNAQIPRAAAAASYFTQGDKLFCVRVSCVDAAESEPAPAPSPPDFSGEPEPITVDVLAEAGIKREWLRKVSSHSAKVQVAVDSCLAPLGTITDARKLRAIMEIVRA